MDKVLVTGITGFIGLHCAQQLLAAGYAVRGTLRSAARKQEVIDAMAKTNSKPDSLEIVVADLTKDAGWDEAVAGCKYVLHVASPIMVGAPKHEDDLIKPAVEGTRRVLSAAIRHKVEKLVLTSSCAAITEGGEGKTSFTEADWSAPGKAKMDAYYKSKTLAERLAWDMIAQQPDGVGTKLAVINPAGVVGPILTDDIGTSNEFLRLMLRGEMARGAPRMHLGFVDVRDVAQAHLMAMTNDKADGERFIISERGLWLKDIGDVLAEAGFEKVPQRHLPDWLIRIIAIFNKEARQLSLTLGQERNTPADKARKRLGWKPRDVRKSIVETARQLVERGLVQT